MKKNLKIIALVLLVTLALTGCGESNKEPEVSLEDAKANVVKLISDTKFDELTEEERNTVSDIQKEYMAKIEKAKTLEEADKLAKAYEKDIKVAVADKSRVPDTDVTKEEVKEESSDKNDTSSKTSNTSTSNKNTSASTSNKNGSSSASSSSSAGTSKPSGGGSSSSSGSSSGSSSNDGSASNSGNSNAGNSGNDTASTQPKERTVTIKAPIYGPQYTYYWMKDANKNIIFETKDPDEFNAKLNDPNFNTQVAFWGSGGKSDIVGYRESTYTESEYNVLIKDSDIVTRTDLLIILNYLH
ncbi:MAG: hypothetical protein PUE18_10265, partial [Firmicutes bacterium]|nr:hypothetical protein [Bacillota bacterium]